MVSNSPSAAQAGVSLPDKRKELMQLLAELADGERQRNLWIKHIDYPNSSGIDEIFHFMFDDTDIGTDSYSEIGRILKNRSEADVMKKLSLSLKRLLNRLGDQNSDIYVHDAEWPEVMGIALYAMKVFDE